MLVHIGALLEPTEWCGRFIAATLPILVTRAAYIDIMTFANVVQGGIKFEGEGVYTPWRGVQTKPGDFP